MSSSAVALKAGLTEKRASQTRHQHTMKAHEGSFAQYGDRTAYSHCGGDAIVAGTSIVN